MDNEKRKYVGFPTQNIFLTKNGKEDMKCTQIMRD